MYKKQKIRCPNCGSYAQRIYLDNHQIETSCSVCDYLMINCSDTLKVLEAYAPGMTSHQALIRR